MTQRSGHLRLNACVFDAGLRDAAGQPAGNDPFAGAGLEDIKNLVCIAERGKLDSVFVAEADRYAHAAVFVEVSRRQSDGWNEVATVADKSRGVWSEPGKALSLPRPPQGSPRLVQAGSPEAGTLLAARCADAVFTAHQTLKEAQHFYADVKRHARRAGRRPESIEILSGIVPVLGGTERQARARRAELDERVLPEYARGGHRTIVGTPEQIADAIALWWNHCAADGFNVMPPALPSGLEAFVDEVVPILQKRRLFRLERTGPLELLRAKRDPAAWLDRYERASGAPLPLGA